MSLEPVRYEFPLSSVASGQADDWVVIALSAVSPLGSWSHQEACLMTWEAKEVSAWLRSVANGLVEPVEPDNGELLEPSLFFIEPALGFNLSNQTESAAELRVYLTYGLAPPWLDVDERCDPSGFFLPVAVPIGDLDRAADAWDQEWIAFPERSAARP